MTEEIISSQTLISDMEAHFKVVAGPGAGKTTWLINHIRNIARHSSRLNKSRKIACITYTNVGVETIIDRLGDAIDLVEVSTIHGFLYANVVKPYLFLIKDRFNLHPEEIDGHDDIIPSHIYQWKEATSQVYLNDDRKVTEALASLCWKFNEGNELELVFREPWRGRISDRLSIRNNSLIEYKKIMWEKGLLHHEDVLYFSYLILNEHEDVRRVLRAKYPYLFIDEFQDTNPIQAEIVKLLAETETVVGVIGDSAQSIYKFQGADVEQFISFELPGMKKYRINNNHRSTEEIIKVLNHMRVDIVQESPERTSGPVPTILVGDALLCRNYVLQEFRGELCVLCYSNAMANEMRLGIYGDAGDDYLLKLYFVDSSNKRKYIVFNAIKAVESARKGRFKEAIKMLSKACGKKDGHQGQKDGLRLLHLLLEKYETYKNEKLIAFYKIIKESGIVDIERLVNRGEAKPFYESTNYADLAIQVRFSEDGSMHRTIHKAKGAQFEGVLLVLDDSHNEMAFLVNPDMTNEEHRVYYVALSRAKKHLYISVPELNDDGREALVNVGFSIINVE